MSFGINDALGALPLPTPLKFWKVQEAESLSGFDVVVGDLLVFLKQATNLYKVSRFRPSTGVSADVLSNLVVNNTPPPDLTGTFGGLPVNITFTAGGTNQVTIAIGGIDPATWSADEGP